MSRRSSVKASSGVARRLAYAGAAKKKPNYVKRFSTLPQRVTCGLLRELPRGLANVAVARFIL